MFRQHLGDVIGDLVDRRTSGVGRSNRHYDRIPLDLDTAQDTHFIDRQRRYFRVGDGVQYAAYMGQGAVGIVAIYWHDVLITTGGWACCAAVLAFLAKDHLGARYADLGGHLRWP